MPDPLFTLPELDTYTQSTVPVAAGTLVLALVTTLIRNEVGAATYDALTDVSVLKPVALDVSKRMLLNPGGMRSEQIGNYSVTWATETLSGLWLSVEDRAQIRAALGLSTDGAFTIRPVGSADCSVSTWRRW